VPSVLLQYVLRAAFAGEVARRAEEAAADAVEAVHARLGLFLLPHAPLLPGVPFTALAFEPRYVLLVDRCWENGLMFGVQAGAGTQTLGAPGTALVRPGAPVRPDRGERGEGGVEGPVKRGAEPLVAHGRRQHCAVGAAGAVPVRGGGAGAALAAAGPRAPARAGGAGQGGGGSCEGGRQ
jgi:hypothetical protein